jgi:GNAT superfamily N-acetyltransferase
LSNNSLTLRPALPEDEAFLYAVYASTRAEEAALLGDAARIEAFLRMQFDMQTRAYRMQFPRADYSVIMVGDEPVGRFIVWRTDAEIRVIDIALLPEHRGAGYGEILMRRMLAEAEQTGKPLRLQVDRFNRARRLYDRLGFVQTGETGTHFQMEWRADFSAER